MSWRKVVAVAVPLAVLFFALGFIVALEVQRGPDWRLELEAYAADAASSGETIVVEEVTEARQPHHFTAAMGVPVRSDGVRPTFPPEAVRCALLVRQPAPGGAAVRQVVFLAYHSDALYQVGWLAYEGPEEPLGARAAADLAAIECDLDVSLVGE
jgi:hypothetical protein